MSSANQAQDNLTLFETSKLLLQELRTTNATMQQGLQQQQHMMSQLQDLLYLVNGFTSGGASFNGYLPDAFVTAYIAVLGPVLAQRLGDQEIGLEELMKGGTLLARTLLEELSAYRSEQEARDVVSDAIALLNDPWRDSDDNADQEEP